MTPSTGAMASCALYLTGSGAERYGTGTVPAALRVVARAGPPGEQQRVRRCHQRASQPPDDPADDSATGSGGRSLVAAE